MAVLTGKEFSISFPFTRLTFRNLDTLKNVLPCPDKMVMRTSFQYRTKSMPFLHFSDALQSLDVMSRGYCERKLQAVIAVTPSYTER